MTEIPIKLTDWAHNQINTMMQATSKDFDQAFDNFVASNVHVTLNGKHVSRDAYKKALKDEMTGDVSASVKFLGSVEMPTQNTSPEDGTAGIFYSTTMQFDPKLQGLRQSVTENSSMNMIVKNQPVVKPTPGKISTADMRRAFTINHVQAIQSILV